MWSLLELLPLSVFLLPPPCLWITEHHYIHLVVGIRLGGRAVGVDDGLHISTAVLMWTGDMTETRPVKTGFIWDKQPPFINNERHDWNLENSSLWSTHTGQCPRLQ